MSENTNTSSDITPPSSYTRSTSIWFADGNIVLLCVADGDTDNTAFRIHRSILSHHSRVFKDMFAVSGGADEEMMDGCPVVRIHDKADDMTNLLRRLYSLESIGAKRSPSLELISSIMGLASKYIVDGLRQELVAHLLDIFPTTLEEYASASQFRDNPLLGIDIGLNYDIPAIIPAACYRAALLDSEKIFDGFRLPDGTSTVSAAARVLCMRLKERLILWIQGKLYNDDEERKRPPFLPCTEHPCSSNPPGWDYCRGIDVQDESLLSGVEHRYLHFEFDIFSSDEHDFDPYEDLSCSITLCSHCLCFIRDSGAEFRYAAWDLLPTFCDMEHGWQTLRDRAAGVEEKEATFNFDDF